MTIQYHDPEDDKSSVVQMRLTLGQGCTSETSMASPAMSLDLLQKCLVAPFRGSVRTEV